MMLTTAALWRRAACTPFAAGQVEGVSDDYYAAKRDNDELHPWYDTVAVQSTDPNVSWYAQLRHVSAFKWDRMVPDKRSIADQDNDLGLDGSESNML